MDLTLPLPAPLFLPKLQNWFKESKPDLSPSLLR